MKALFVLYLHQQLILLIFYVLPILVGVNVSYCAFFKQLYLCIYFWPRWVFSALCRLSLLWRVVAICSLLVVWFSLSQSTGCRCTDWSDCSWTTSWTWQLQPWAPENGSVAVVHRLSCSAACGIFPDQGSNSCVPCIGRRILNLLRHKRSPHCGFNLHFPHG